MSLFAALALATTLSAAPASGARPATLQVAIVLYPGVELLDFAGPGEVLAAAGNAAAQRGVPATRVFTVASTKEPIVSQGFVKVLPEFSVDDAPRPDVVVIPGGSSGQLTDDPRFMRWLAAVQAEATTLTVCTGAFAAWKAGMLDGLTATTHHGSTARLRQLATRTTVVDGRRFVDNGKVITTAGVSAGIDGALHLVARRFGRAVADETARYMEYHWSPEPWLARGYTHLNPSLDERGRAHQQAGLLQADGDLAGAARAYRALAAQDPEDAFAWLGLADALGEAGGGAEALAMARKASGFEATRGDALFLVACEEARAGRRAEALQAVEAAVKAGFRAYWLLERAPTLEGLQAEPRLRAVIAALRSPARS